MKLLTQAISETPLGKIGGKGLGPFGKIDFSAQGALEAITRTISSIIGIMTVAAGIWFIFQFLVGGFGWMSAGGDKSKLQEAQHRLTNSFIGLIIVVAGWAILALAGEFFGYDILITNPGELIKNLGL